MIVRCFGPANETSALLLLDQTQPDKIAHLHQPRIRRPNTQFLAATTAVDAHGVLVNEEKIAYTGGDD